MMTGESSNILVSNEVESNKLYLKIKPAEERVIVARNYNVSAQGYNIIL